jgi:hypothetical protein
MPQKQIKKNTVSTVFYHTIISGFFGNFKQLFLIFIFFAGQCVDHSFAYVAPFIFLRDVWIRTQRDAVASRRASNLATHLPNFNTTLSPTLRFQCQRMLGSNSGL